MPSKLFVNQTFNAENSFYDDNWFARQQSRRNHSKMILSGILMRFEFLLLGGLSYLSLYTIEIGQMTLDAAVIVLSVAVCVKIIKNRKARKKS